MRIAGHQLKVVIGLFDIHKTIGRQDTPDLLGMAFCG